jgi:hypothetical protein
VPKEELAARLPSLSLHGWKIRALSRVGRDAVDSQRWDWVKGDALERDSIVAAAEGVDAIVHTVNPPESQYYKVFGTKVFKIVVGLIFYRQPYNCSLDRRRYIRTGPDEAEGFQTTALSGLTGFDTVGIKPG